MIQNREVLGFPSQRFGDPLEGLQSLINDSDSGDHFSTGTLVFSFILPFNLKEK